VNSIPTEFLVVGILAAIFVMFSAFIGVVWALVAPVKTQLENLEANSKDAETRARGELDKSERGLKEQTIRVEGIIRQTVEDVDDKLRREGQLIEEKTRIQFADQQRQIEQLRTIVEQNRIELWNLRNGVKHDGEVKKL